MSSPKEIYFSICEATTENGVNWKLALTDGRNLSICLATQHPEIGPSVRTSPEYQRLVATLDESIKPAIFSLDGENSVFPGFLNFMLGDAVMSKHRTQMPSVAGTSAIAMSHDEICRLRDDESVIRQPACADSFLRVISGPIA